MRIRRILLPALAGLIALASAPAARAGIPSYGRYAAASRPMMGRTNQGQAMARRGQQQIAQDLRLTRAILLRADHDYQGRRLRAVEEINVALRALGHGGNGAGAPGMGMGMGNGNRNGNGMAGNRRREPQAASDAQLRRAYQNLVQIQSQLVSLPGPQDARARLAVTKAAGHLQMALEIR